MKLRSAVLLAAFAAGIIAQTQRPRQDPAVRLPARGTRGAVTLLELLEGYAGHAESHARQLQDLRQAYKARK